MAGPDTVALLQLSRDGRTRDDLHRGDGSGFAAIVARKTVRLSLDAVDVDGLRTAPLHCEHCGMDDRGTRATAVADLWINAHRQWCFSARGCGKCVVYFDWV